MKKKISLQLSSGSVVGSKVAGGCVWGGKVPEMEKVSNGNGLCSLQNISLVLISVSLILSKS